jgi:hypothetical protein
VEKNTLTAMDESQKPLRALKSRAEISARATDIPVRYPTSSKQDQTQVDFPLVIPIMDRYDRVNSSGV